MSRGHSINLEKGESRDVQQGIRRVLVGCGWDAQTGRSQHDFDLDVSCALLNAKGRMPTDKHLAYYGALRFEQDVVVHTGDNLTGDGDGDDERLLIDLARMPPDVAQIDLLITIYKAHERHQTFGMISDCYIRIVDVTQEEDTSVGGPLYQALSYPGREFCRCNVNDEALIYDGLLFGSLVRERGGWRFKAVQKELYGGLNVYLGTVTPEAVAELPLAVRMGARSNNALQVMLPQPALKFMSDNKSAVGASVIALVLTQFIGIGPLCVMGAVFIMASLMSRRQ